MAPHHRHRLPTDDYDDSSDEDGGGAGAGGGGRGHDGGAAAARALGLPGPERRARPNILITGTPGTGKSTLAEAIVSLCGGVPMPAAAATTPTTPPLPLLAPLPPICVGDRVKAQGLHYGYDACMSAFLLDEDKVVDALEREVAGPSGRGGGGGGSSDDDEEDESAGGNGASFLGGRVVEHHGSDFFPARWFDLVLVTRCSDTATLWGRLERRRQGGGGGGGGAAGGGAGGGAGGDETAAAAAGGGYTDDKIRENVQAEMMGVCSEEAHDAWLGVPHCRVAEVRSDTPEDVERAAAAVSRWCALWRRGAGGSGGSGGGSGAGGGAEEPPPFPPPAEEEGVGAA